MSSPTEWLPDSQVATHLPPVQQEYSRKDNSQLLWSAFACPHPPEKIEDYLRRVSADKPCGPGRHEEDALQMLQQFNFDFKVTIAHFRPIPLQELDPRSLSNWSSEEIEMFEHFLHEQKDFHSVSAQIRTKTTAECVEFYYYWKKTERADCWRKLRKKISQGIFELKEERAVAKAAAERAALNAAKKEAAQLQLQQQREQQRLQRQMLREKERQNNASESKASKPEEESIEPKKKRESSSSKPKPGVYIVERILDHRTRGSKNEYLVKWEGYSLRDSTWEPETNLTNNVCLQRFIEKRKRAKEANGLGSASPVRKPDGEVKRRKVIIEDSEGPESDDYD